MKKQLPGFIAGLLCAVVLFGVVGGAGALITGPSDIKVYPINIMVNGQVFQPKNVNGELVDVFKYGGTTYVPLRAIAETFGLEVGYDAEKNLATVGQPGSSIPPKQDDVSASLDYSDWSAEEEAAYQEFKRLWKVSIYSADKIGDPGVNLHGKDETSVEKFILSTNSDTIEKYCLRFDEELFEMYNLPLIFYFDETNKWSRWGWMDELTDNGWSCGLKHFLGS